MKDGDRYPVPARRHRVEESIRGSRFITTLARAEDAAAAHSFIVEIRDEFPDATHNCWAFVAGSPGSNTALGMSDAGEPHGTAGRPMLEALLHSGVGEVVAVATRYFGGTKLGRGGLQRAYAGGVRLALDSLPLAERLRRVTFLVEVAYAALDPVRRLAAELEATITNEEFGAVVRMAVGVPEMAVDRFRDAILELTAGRARIEAAGD